VELGIGVAAETAEGVAQLETGFGV